MSEKENPSVNSESQSEAQTARGFIGELDAEIKKGEKLLEEYRKQQRHDSAYVTPRINLEAKLAELRHTRLEYAKLLRTKLEKS